MQRINLDNGSTSYPKAPGVGQAMLDYVEHVGVNIGRGGYEAAYSAAGVVLDTMGLYPLSVIFTVVAAAGIVAFLPVLFLKKKEVAAA